MVFFDTGKLLASEISLPIILQNEGVYHYFCTMHKGMRGTIIVEGDNAKNEMLMESFIPQWIRHNVGCGQMDKLMIQNLFHQFNT
jgi:hypothetical protein